MDRDYLHKLLEQIGDSGIEEAQRYLESLVSNHSDFVFGVDLDEVCADFYGGLRPIAAEWLGVDTASMPEDISWGLAEWGIDQAPGGYLALHRHAVTHCDLFRKLHPMPGAAQALRRLSKNDVRIRIITHRLYMKYFHKQAIDQTVEWLDRFDIPYWDLCFMKDKGAVGANLYIDDSPDNIAKLRADGNETIIFTSPTNRALEGLRADNWDQVEEIVLSRKEQWRQHLQIDRPKVP